MRSSRILAAAAVVALAALLVVADAFAAHRATRPATVPVQPHSYSWTIDNNLGEAYLYRGGVQIGGYSFVQEVYREYTAGAGTWGEPTEAPVPVPADPMSSDSPAADYGVRTDKLHSKEPATVTTNGGKAVTAADAAKLFSKRFDDAKIPDDAAKLRLTVIGEKSKRETLTGEIATREDLKDIRERVAVYSIPANHWTVAEYGFRADGAPTVYLQATDPDSQAGRVLHRQDDNANPDATYTAIRRAIKDYDQSKDPDRRRADLPPLLPISLGNHTGLLAFLAGAFGSVLAVRRS